MGFFCRVADSRRPRHHAAPLQREHEAPEPDAGARLGAAQDLFPAGSGKKRRGAPAGGRKPP